MIISIYFYLFLLGLVIISEEGRKEGRKEGRRERRKEVRKEGSKKAVAVGLAEPGTRK